MFKLVAELPALMAYVQRVGALPSFAKVAAQDAELAAGRQGGGEAIAAHAAAAGRNGDPAARAIVNIRGAGAARSEGDGRAGGGQGPAPSVLTSPLFFPPKPLCNGGRPGANKAKRSRST
jgi:hypothetical protein